MARLQSDALEMLLAAAEGKLDKIKLKWDSRVALTVVMAAEGYPGTYIKGSEIKGVADADALKDVVVFHAGTMLGDDGALLANGGRVLNVTARARTVGEAQRLAYEAVGLIDWPGGFCRKDIGWRARGCASALHNMCGAVRDRPSLSTRRARLRGAARPCPRLGAGAPWPGRRERVRERESVCVAMAHTMN